MQKKEKKNAEVMKTIKMVYIRFYPQMQFL